MNNRNRLAVALVASLVAVPSSATALQMQRKPSPEIRAAADAALKRFGSADAYRKYLWTRPGYSSPAEIETLTAMTDDPKILKYAERMRESNKRRDQRMGAARSAAAAITAQRAAGTASSFATPSTGEDSWARYRRESAEREAKIKAMHDYTYGKSKRNPYDPWLKDK